MPTASKGPTYATRALRLWHIVSVLGGLLVGIALPLMLQKDSLSQWAYLGSWLLWCCGVMTIVIGTRRTGETVRKLIGASTD